jgi:hypothetical protein
MGVDHSELSDGGGQGGGSVESHLRSQLSTPATKFAARTEVFRLQAFRSK